MQMDNIRSGWAPIKGKGMSQKRLLVSYASPESKSLSKQNKLKSILSISLLNKATE